MQRDALGAERLDQRFAQVHVEAAQRQRLAVHQIHVRAESGEDAGEFHRDVARSDDRHALRHVRQIERGVRDDAKFRAGDRQAHRMAAGADDDVLGGDALAADIERVRIDEGGARLEDGRAGVVEQPLVDAVEPADLAVLRGDQLRPVVRPLLDLPAETGGVLGPGAVFAGLHQQLLRHAADIDAGAAPEPLLGDGDARAVTRGDARTAHARRAAADDEQVEVHGGPLLSGS